MPATRRIQVAAALVALCGLAAAIEPNTVVRGGKLLAATMLDPAPATLTRRLLHNSPISYIMAGSPSMVRPSAVYQSPVYRLPLNFLSNGKPLSILNLITAESSKRPFNKLIPSVSKILRLPISYISNAKPSHLFFKKPFNLI